MIILKNWKSICLVIFFYNRVSMQNSWTVKQLILNLWILKKKLYFEKIT